MSTAARTTLGRRARRIVFAGGGHAHLHSLLRAGELVRRGFEVVLVSPSPHLYYSGMATGIISGAYKKGENCIDVRRLVENGGTFIEGRVKEIRAKDRTFVLENDDHLPYDAASVCLGSAMPRRAPGKNGADGEEAGVIPVKPIECTGEIPRRLLSLQGTARGAAPEVLVVGGGAAGCEVAANVLALLDGLGPESGRVTIAEEKGSLLPDAPEKAQKRIHEYLREKGARILTNTPLASISGGAALARDGRELPCDLPVLAVGTSPPAALFRASRLTTGRDGGLWVDRHLRSENDARLFGGGDCISYKGEPLPKLGVFAVRQGPVLYHNLQAALRGEPLAAYKPQKRYLYILNLGDNTGLAVYGPLVWRGRLSYALKERIDKKFVGRYSG